jgi:hypothetical protein
MKEIPVTEVDCQFVHGDFVRLDFVQALAKQNEILIKALEMFEGQPDYHDCFGTAELALEQIQDIEEDYESEIS